MALTRDQIENIAHLARLELNETEIPVYQQSLSSILDFVGELEPCRHAGRRAHGASACRPGAAPAPRRGHGTATSTSCYQAQCAAGRGRALSRAQGHRVSERRAVVTSRTAGGARRRAARQGIFERRSSRSCTSTASRRASRAQRLHHGDARAGARGGRGSRSRAGGGDAPVRSPVCRIAHKDIFCTRRRPHHVRLAHARQLRRRRTTPRWSRS